MARKLGFKIIRYNEVTSTNAVLRELAGDGVEPGTVVTSRIQTEGRGRMGRKWESPEGGLWMSVLLEVEEGFDSNRLGLISLMAGSSVATAMIMEYGLDAGLKWPNDVLINGRKACGVLAEILAIEQRRFVVLGIGVNVNNKIKENYDFSDVSTSIAEELGKTVNIGALENTVLEELNFRVGLLANAEYGKILEDWREMSETLGRHVAVVTPGNELRGLAKDIDENGSLLLDMDGRREKVLVGDCRHLD